MPEKNNYLYLTTEQDRGQRIDNFLIKHLKGVPKSRIYRAIRNGEVRINGGRIKVFAKLKCDDQVRIPPLRVSHRPDEVRLQQDKLEQIKTLYEDEHLLIVDKPSGIAVHGGTGLSFGLIEQFRESRQPIYLELVHRLDRETSGCLILAKDKQSLLGMQQQFTPRAGQQKTISKHYVALVMGAMANKTLNVDTRLSRVMQGFEKRTVVDEFGQTCHSEIKLRHQYKQCALVDILLITGRTHQARVHCASSGHPIAGDKLYGDSHFNQSMKLPRLFLHAHQLVFRHPVSQQKIEVRCPLPEVLQTTIDNMME